MTFLGTEIYPGVCNVALQDDSGGWPKNAAEAQRAWPRGTKRARQFCTGPLRHQLTT